MRTLRGRRALSGAALGAALVAAVGLRGTTAQGVCGFSSANGTALRSLGVGTVFSLCPLQLVAGQTLRAGTTGVAGAACAGDTYLALLGPDGNLLAANDDSTGLCSFLSVTAAASGAHTLAAGCYSSSSCSGVAAYDVADAPPAAPPSPPPSPEAPLPAGAAACASYSANGSAVGAVFGHPVYARCALSVAPGDTVTLGTGGLAGAACSGDTWLALEDSNGNVLASNDDSNGLCSFLQYTYTAQAAATLTVAQGCFSSYAPCGGRVAYALTQPPPAAPPSPPSPPAAPLPAGVGACAAFNTTDGAQPLRSLGVGSIYATCAVTLTAGQPITLGTAGITGAVCSGDTYVALLGPDGSLLASNDDYSSLCSYTAAQAPVNGTYQILSGCYASSSCSGRVTYAVSAATPLPSPPLPAPPRPPLPLGTATCGAYSSSGAQTSSFGGNPVFGTCNVSAAAGQEIVLGTTGITGAACSGDTYVWLLSSDGAVVASNDDSGSLCSRTSFGVVASGVYTIAFGCWQGQACSGEVAYAVDTPPPPPPLPPGVGTCAPYGAGGTPLAQIGSGLFYAECVVALEAGDTLQAGTCGVAGGRCAGDTYVALLGPGGIDAPLAASDDACGLCSSLRVTATASGNHTLLLGCYSTGACSGVVAYAVTSAGAPAPPALDFNSTDYSYDYADYVDYASIQIAVDPVPGSPPPRTAGARSAPASARRAGSRKAAKDTKALEQLPQPVVITAIAEPLPVQTVAPDTQAPADEADKLTVIPLVPGAIAGGSAPTVEDALLSASTQPGKQSVPEAPAGGDGSAAVTSAVPIAVPTTTTATPPSTSDASNVFVTATMVLRGYTLATFGAAEARLLAAVVASTAGVASDAVTVLSISDAAPAPARRKLHAASGGVAVAFAVATPASGAARVTAGVSGVTAAALVGGGLNQVTALSLAVAPAVTQTQTLQAWTAPTTPPPGLSAPGLSTAPRAAAFSHTAAALGAAALLAALL